MSTFVLSFIIFLAVMLVMAIGVILGNREIKGSCGGLNSIEGLSGACDICEGKKECERKRRARLNAH